jgi:hypothetical protein
MITKEFDWETEQLLAEILEQENITSDELLRVLIRDRWLSLRKQAVDLPLRTSDSLYPPASTPAPAAATTQLKQKNSKQVIAEFLKRKRFH